MSVLKCVVIFFSSGYEGGEGGANSGKANWMSTSSTINFNTVLDKELKLDQENSFQAL